MVGDLLVSLERTTIAASLAMLVVMAVRMPLRRLCGCGVAYAAWLAVPATTLATWLPAPAFRVPTLGVVPFTMSTVDSTPTIAAASAAWPWPGAIVLVWAIGMVGTALWQIHLQRAFMRRLGPLTFDDGVAISQSPLIGPCLVGMWRPWVAVPGDFERHYTPTERRLIVAHERAHADAKDPLVNLLCAGLLCLWWFDPLAWFAARLLREDQELARDADVVRQFPGTRRVYAEAMLKTQMPSPIHPPIACRWQTKHPLKERIMSLSLRPSNAARHVGQLVLTTGLLCGAYAAWAQQSPTRDVDGSKPVVATTGTSRGLSDWADARLSSAVTVTAGPKPGQFLVSARITDLATTKVLSEPRLLVSAGTPATMETGSSDLLVRIVVTVNPSGREAAYTSEVRRHGEIESSQSAILVVDPNGVARATTDPASDIDPSPASAAGASSASERGQRPFTLTFRSSDRAELSCVADVFADDGKTEIAAVMRSSWNEQRHEAVFKTIVKTLPPEAERLAASLARCRLGVDSTLTWSVGRQAA